VADRGEDDADLVRRARAGDSSAWDRLVDRLGGRVWAVARAQGLNSADADDVFQITWMRLVTHLDAIREPERVSAWLAATARHESFRVLRRNGRQIPTGDDEDFEGAAVLDKPLDAQMLTNERQKAVWDAVASLPPQCQRLMRLLMADPPFTYEQITEILDMRPGSIGPTRARCLEKLRRRLGAVDDKHERTPS
jgi:RNA polymerase sigma factor (sigma-70 family)